MLITQFLGTYILSSLEFNDITTCDFLAMIIYDTHDDRFQRTLLNTHNSIVK